jgi:hypothetical protein
MTEIKENFTIVYSKRFRTQLTDSKGNLHEVINYQIQVDGIITDRASLKMIFPQHYTELSLKPFGE